MEKMSFEQAMKLMQQQQNDSLSIILTHKKVNRFKTLLLIFYRYPNNDIQYSVGERYDYEIPKNREIDYWTGAEYYATLAEAFKVFNGINS